MTQTSKEYAEALFELALQDGSTDTVSAALDDVREVMAADPAFMDLLKSPAVPREVRVSTLEQCFRGRVPEIVLAILRMLCVKGHMGELDRMITEYGLLNQEHQGIAMAHVTSAVALKEAEKERLRQGLEASFGKKVALQCSLDRTLLGGIRVEIEGKVIDGSIRNKLQQIKEVMDS